MRAPTTLGLAALLLLALGGLYLSHVSLAADPAHTRRRATSSRACALRSSARPQQKNSRPTPSRTRARCASRATRPSPGGPRRRRRRTNGAGRAARGTKRRGGHRVLARRAALSPGAAGRASERTPGPLSTYEPPRRQTVQTAARRQRRS